MRLPFSMLLVVLFGAFMVLNLAATVSFEFILHLLGLRRTREGAAEPGATQYLQSRYHQAD